MTVSKVYVLNERPAGAPDANTFAVKEIPVRAPGEGELLLRTLYLSLDPYMRGRLSEAKSYAKPVELGEVMVGATVAEVVDSNADGFSNGDIVLGYGGWQTYSVERAKYVRKLDPDVVPVTTALGVLGMPGFTAYAGLLEIGKPQPGETVAVAAATGPVGSAVGQIAKIKGARAVGIAGGPQKVEQLREFGFDVCADHRDPDFKQNLRDAVGKGSWVERGGAVVSRRGAGEESAPSGIDVYFENVGGTVWQAVMPLLNTFARVPVCGLVANYNGTTDPSPAGGMEKLMMLSLAKSLTIRGFIQSEFVRDIEPQFLKDMTEWVASGKVQYLEDITNGFENTVDAFVGMLEGKNFGKTIVKFAD